MIKHKVIISLERFRILLNIYRIKLSPIEQSYVYNIFKDIFKYDIFFTYIDEDTEILKYNLNCKYVIEQICYEYGIKI